MAAQETVTLTRAQVEELRAIIHNADSPLGNRLQDVSARLYFALEGAGWTPAAGEQAGAVALLRSLEWSGSYFDGCGYGQESCLACGHDKRNGHAQDCELSKVLAAPSAAIAAREQFKELQPDGTVTGVDPEDKGIAIIASPEEAPPTPPAAIPAAPSDEWLKERTDELVQRIHARIGTWGEQRKAIVDFAREFAALTQPTTVQQADYATERRWLCGRIAHMVLECEAWKAKALAVEPPKKMAPGDWRIDHSAGRPILTYKNCSVIEAEDAEYVLRLIVANFAPAALKTAQTTALPGGNGEGE